MDIQYILRQMRNSFYLSNYKRVLDLFEENFPDANCTDFDIHSILIRTIIALNEPDTSELVDKLMANKKFSQFYRLHKGVIESILKGVLFCSKDKGCGGNTSEEYRIQRERGDCP